MIAIDMVPRQLYPNSMNRRLLIVAGAFLAVAGFGATRWALAEYDALSVGGKTRDGSEAWLEGREIPRPPVIDVRDTPEYWDSAPTLRPPPDWKGPLPEVQDIPDSWYVAPTVTPSLSLPRTTPLRTIYGAGWLVAGLGVACLSAAAFPRRVGGLGSQ